MIINASELVQASSIPPFSEVYHSRTTSGRLYVLYAHLFHVRITSAFNTVVHFSNRTIFVVANVAPRVSNHKRRNWYVSWSLTSTNSLENAFPVANHQPRYKPYLERIQHTRRLKLVKANDDVENVELDRRESIIQEVFSHQNASLHLLSTFNNMWDRHIAQSFPAKERSWLTYDNLRPLLSAPSFAYLRTCQILGNEIEKIMKNQVL